MRVVDTGVLGVLLLALAAPAAAQAPLRLTIDDAIARAVAGTPRLAEARSRVDAAASTVSAREAVGRPTVTIASGALRTNHVDEFGIPQPDGSLRVIFPDLPTNYRARAELAVPIYTAGRVQALVGAATADRRAADADALAAEADVRLDVTTAYWSLVTGRERVTVLTRALARADASLSDVRARVDTGVLPPNEAQSAQAQRARQQVQLIQARNDAALAEAQLARLVGAPPGQAIDPATPVTQPTPGAEGLDTLAFDALVTRARESRPERLALVEREAGLRAAAEAAGASARPQVAAVAAIEPARPNARFVPRADEWRTSWDLGVNVTWPLWDAGRARADRATATAQADSLGHRREDLDQGLAVEVRQRLLDLTSARAAIAASNEAVDAATEAHRVLGERFTAGVATSTDVLEAEVALLEAELERTRLVAALRLAEARLLRTVGEAQP
jgi:outer membrane protein TolC